MANDEASRGLCVSCNYPLRELTEHLCPECGREFDPMNPATMNMGRPMGPVARWLMRPRVWPAVVVAVPAMIATLYDCTQFGGIYGVFSFLVIPSWLTAFAVMGLSLSLSAVTSWFYHQPWIMPSRRQWMSLPALLLMMIAIGYAGIPWRIRFWLSKSELDVARVRLLATADQKGLRDQRLGLIWAEWVTREGETVSVSTSSWGVVWGSSQGRSFRTPLGPMELFWSSGGREVFDYVGYVYSPTGPPSKPEWELQAWEFRYAGGGWYAYVYHE